MRKRILNSDSSPVEKAAAQWLPLDQIASVEVTSEDASHPIENALVQGLEGGWRASQTGEQTIRLIFDAPQHITRVHLEFTERDTERSQEFLLRWCDGQIHHDIVRQQWNFSPSGSTRQSEDFTVDLYEVWQLELVITPDRSGGTAHATLDKMRVT